MDINNALTRSIHRSCQKGRTAILFTGGLDSAVLVALAYPLRPLLVFTVIDSPACYSYNKTSTTICKKIAQHLGLRFLTIRVDKRSYLQHFRKTARIIGQPFTDKDLPAVNYLFAILQKMGINTAISGIGSDEIFSLTKAQLRSFLANKAATTLKIHKKIARNYGLSFDCPYLSPCMRRYGLSASTAQKKDKHQLKEILQRSPEIYKILKDRAPAHSSIPFEFWSHFKDALQNKSIRSCQGVKKTR